MKHNICVMNSRIKEDVQKIFEFWCEVTKIEKNDNHIKSKSSSGGVGVSRNIGGGSSGIIIESFPESFHDEQIIAKIPDFVYPCEFENDSVQSYSFVLTSDDSKWRFGFCRHDPKTQTAMVLVTYLPWHDTFLRLLSVLGELKRNKQNGEFETFLSETYNKGVPELGGSLKLFYNSGQNHFIFQRPSQFQLPSIPENHNLNLYYNFVEPKNMISVFAAMLAERRIIFTSRRFDKLSSCIQAANAFLYPMVWQHIFIPILPMKLKDVLSAPMPYLIGVPEAVLQTMTPEELGDVVILNCDNGQFESPFDDIKPIPSDIISTLKKQLNNSNDHIGDRVSKIFLGVLVQLIGGYRDAVQFTQGKKITWDRDIFIETRPLHLRSFLMKMMELQIFQQFIEERLNMLNTGLGFSDEFELETLRYSEKLGKRGKHYKEFLKNVKEKTNPAVRSAVKSVKEGSRGVKTAYKDLKSKLRDITPPKSSSSSHFHSHISTLSSSSSSSTQSSSFKGEKLRIFKGQLKGNFNNQNDDDNDDGNIERIIVNGHRNNHLHHHSAPNSPVFTRHQTIETNIFDGSISPSSSDLLNSTATATVAVAGAISETTRNKKQQPMSSLQVSNSQLLNGFRNHHSVSRDNNNSKDSPTISPSSSLCSSDMNISQELQNHPLFKSPIVDRTLKPSNSLEYCGNNKLSTTSSSTTITSPKVVIVPNSRPLMLKPVSSHHYLHHNQNEDNQKSFLLSSSSSSSSQPISSTSQLIASISISADNILLENIHINDNDNDETKLNQQQQQHQYNSNNKLENDTKSTFTLPLSSQKQYHYNTTNSIFDTPPDMPSPPIPPKRMNSSNSGSNLKKISVLNNINGDNDNNKKLSLQTQQPQTSSLSSSSLSRSFPSSTQQNSAIDRLCVIPKPVSRNKFKEIPSRINEEKLKNNESSVNSGNIHEHDDNTMKDLISLDDSNNGSFELEDFDPLNQNAKPFPPMPVGLMGSSSLHKPQQKEVTPPQYSNIQQQQQQQSNNMKTMSSLPSSNQQNSNQLKNFNSSISSSSSVHNPLYTFFSPQHRHTTPQHQQQQQQSHKLQKSTISNSNIITTNQLSSSSSSSPSKDDDFELLRKYGLDQFSLTAAVTATTSNQTINSSNNTSSKALNKSEWTVFE